MATDAQVYLRAAYPPPLHRHLSDEDIAAMLDAAEKRSRAARKASETRKQAEQKKEAQCGTRIEDQ